MSPLHDVPAPGLLVEKIYFNKPAGTITRAATTVGAFSTAWQITGVVVATGQNVRLRVTAMAGSPTSTDRLICIKRETTQIAAMMFTQNTGQAANTSFVMEWIDENPGASTYTYEVQGACFTSGTMTIYQTNPTTDSTGGSSIFIAEVYTP